MDNGNILITVFTPAYNVENYIVQCIESVLNQTYKNFEWIIVENASTDSTPEIIETYAKLDSRIRVIYHTVNKNNFAQNYIKQYARGKYIVKIDSDDWLEPDYLEKLLYPLEKHKADISMCGAIDYEEETGKEFPHEYGELNGVYLEEDIKDHFIEMRSYLGTYWGKMFRKDIFCAILPEMKSIEEKLKEGKNFGGDTAFILYYLMECKKIIFINKRMYHYRIHSNGYAACTMGVGRISCYLTLRNIEKQFLNKCNAETEENNMLVDVTVWTNLEKLLKSIINSNLLLGKKLEIIHEIYIDPRIKQLREESCNSKVRTILSTYAAWYFMNMEGEQAKDLRDILILLEPDIFVNITDNTYEWMSQQQELMAYIIIGEFAGAREYVRQIITESNKNYISELMRWI